MALDAAVALSPERFVLELLFASLRTGAALALLPALGGQLLPVRVRIGLAGAAGYLALGTPNPPAVPQDLLGAPGLAAIAGELLIGLVVALAVHTAFAAALVAGEWLAQAMGLGFATTIDPSMPQAPMLSALLALVTWALFLTAGGHLLLIDILLRSYAAMPTAGALFDPERLWAIATWGSHALATGMVAALPIGVALLLANLAIGMTARSAPQLNLFSIGFPLLLLLGLVGLPMGLPALADTLAGGLTRMLEQLSEVLLG